MLTTRKRPHHSAAGLATALTLSLSLLSGCNGARFMMGGDPTQPTTPTNTQGQAPGASASEMKLTTFTLKGHADYFGTPIANAKVTLFDAITGEPAKVISAGGGNYVVTPTTRSFVQVAAPSFTTDANGDFDITYQGPANAKGQGLPVRVIVSTAPAGYQVQQAAGGSFGAGTSGAGSSGAGAAAGAGAAGGAAAGGITAGALAVGVAAAAAIGVAVAVASNNSNNGPSFQNVLSVDPASTVTMLNGSAVFNVMKSLKTDAAVDVSYGYLAQLADLNKRIASTLTKEDFDAISKTIDKDGHVTSDGALRSFFSKAGIGDAFDASVKAGLKTVADKMADKNNVVAAVTLTQDDFIGTNFKVSLENGVLTVTNTVTGETTTFDAGKASNGSTGDGNGTVDPTQQDGVTEDVNLTGNPDDAPVFSSASFNPDVTLSKVSGSLTVTVDQPTGSDDIAAIFARVPKSTATGSFFSGHVLTADAVASKVTVTKTSQTFGLTLAQDNSLNYTAQAGPRFANVSLSSPLWQGWLQTSGGVHVAKFGIFDNGGYYYLVTNYQLNNAVTTSSGHHTVLKTNDAELSSTAKAEISIVSRHGAIVERTN